MLKIFKDLKSFFEDCYREINVRDYAKIIKASPPTASKLAKGYCSEDLLKKRIEKQNVFFRANRENCIFVRLSQIYWQEKIRKTGLLERIQNELSPNAIILFGSLSKAEARKDSDMDLAVLSYSNKEIDVSEFSEKLGRKIQIFSFESLQSIKSNELRNSILNGTVINGVLRWE